MHNEMRRTYYSVMDIIALAQQTSLNSSGSTQQDDVDKVLFDNKRKKKKLRKSLFFIVAFLAIILCVLEIFLVFFQRSNPKEWLEFAHILLKHNQTKYGD